MERVTRNRLPDAEAWEGLEEMREGLQGFLSRQCSDDNDIEDTIQETFLRAARYRRSHRVRNLRPWATRIALNVLADARRRGVRTQAAPASPDPSELCERVESSPADAAQRIDDIWLEGDAAGELLQHSLGGLREGDRRLLDVYYGGEQRTSVAGEECGIPQRLVKVRLYRARKRLLTALRLEVALQPRWRRMAS
jgi:RNA polymerase sigma factor (sigma-70 family)